MVPAAPPVLSDEDLIAALGTRSAGPAEVRALFEIVQKPMEYSILKLAQALRLERTKPTPRHRIACGPVGLTGAAVSYRLDETPPRLHQFFGYAPKRWSTQTNQAGIFFALWLHSYLLELLLDGDAEAKVLRLALDRWEADGTVPDAFDDDHIEAVCDPRLMVDSPVVHPGVVSHCRRLVADAAAEATEAETEPAEEEAAAEPEDRNDDGGAG
jgi:hypothetical protein